MTPIRISLEWTVAAIVAGAMIATVVSAPAPTAAWTVPGASNAPAGATTFAVTPAYHTYAWPVQGPVIRSFEPPTTPYSSGHRGIDIGVPFGTPLKAAGDGVVAFAGWVGGSLFISIDHPDGVRTTYSWLSAVSVKAGQHVSREQIIGATGHGHPEVAEPHLHFGARIGSTYIDPMLLLEGGSVAGLIHLAPLQP
jgi:murein DD-endopeptidase MepM/ murein hydrolase activator NlpD